MGTHKFGVYENWVTSDTQKNKLKVTLCALNIYFLFPLFFIDTWHSSHVFLSHEPTSHSPENSHYSVSVHTTIFPAFSSELS